MDDLEELIKKDFEFNKFQDFFLLNFNQNDNFKALFFIEKIIINIINNKKCTCGFSVISSLTLGIILSPWSWGLLPMTIFLILFEIILFVFTKKFNLLERVSITMAYILGYIIGRIVSNDNVTEDGTQEINYFFGTNL